MRALEYFALLKNGFTGSLPEGIFIKAMDKFYLWDNFFAGTVPESPPRTYTSTSLGEIAQYPGLRPPKFFGSFLSFPQDVASSAQSLKPRKLCGA
eukprot:1014505-Amphidinium_carterae.1